jgi:hypothetical protein
MLLRALCLFMTAFAGVGLLAIALRRRRGL